MTRTLSALVVAATFGAALVLAAGFEPVAHAVGPCSPPGSPPQCDGTQLHSRAFWTPPAQLRPSYCFMPPVPRDRCADSGSRPRHVCARRGSGPRSGQPAA